MHDCVTYVPGMKCNLCVRKYKASALNAWLEVSPDRPTTLLFLLPHRARQMSYIPPVRVTPESLPSITKGEHHAGTLNGRMQQRQRRL